MKRAVNPLALYANPKLVARRIKRLLRPISIIKKGTHMKRAVNPLALYANPKLVARRIKRLLRPISIIKK